MSDIRLGLQDAGVPSSILYVTLLAAPARLTQVQFHWIGRRIQTNWVGRECAFEDVRVRQVYGTGGAAAYRIEARADAAFRARGAELVREFNERFRCAALAGDGWFEWYTTADKVDTEFVKTATRAAGWPSMRVALFCESRGTRDGK